MTDNTRYQDAQTCAGEAIEALLSIYWGDSFDAEQLESTLAETIHSFTQGARKLTEAHPMAKEFELVESLEPSSLSLTAQTEGLVPPFKHKVRRSQPLGTAEMLIPIEVLRLVAVGSPQTVNSCVAGLFRLGYARTEEWSRHLPAANPGQVMRILTKRVAKVS
ncbi:MAG: hypothetical protein KME47_16530 [Nodosilinea sp. WJT8-NPBG4]|nr:hypothetical protein [Nodosilinea sp. WJT8-NPBG4]